MSAQPVPVAAQAARPADAERIVALRDAAARWQLQRGIRQWAAGEVTAHEVLIQILEGQWWVVREPDGSVSAAVRVIDQDLVVWGAASGRAVYVHGLVIDRSCAGEGVAAALLRWVESRSRAWDCAAVRLDCVASNGRLRRYYTELGYRVVGEKSFDTGWSAVVLMEKQSA